MKKNFFILINLILICFAGCSNKDNLLENTLWGSTKNSYKTECDKRATSFGNIYVPREDYLLFENRNNQLYMIHAGSFSDDIFGKVYLDRDAPMCDKRVFKIKKIKQNKNIYTIKGSFAKNVDSVLGRHNHLTNFEDLDFDKKDLTFDLLVSDDAIEFKTFLGYSVFRYGPRDCYYKINQDDIVIEQKIEINTILKNTVWQEESDFGRKDIVTLPAGKYELFSNSFLAFQIDDDVFYYLHGETEGGPAIVEDKIRITRVSEDEKTIHVYLKNSDIPLGFYKEDEYLIPVMDKNMPISFTGKKLKQVHKVNN